MEKDSIYSKRYARLADGNVRNFQELQGKCGGSRV